MSRIEGYKFGQKNNWRRRTANEIARRIGVGKRQATVIYLPGLEDLDREVLVAKGFANQNLIAVDRDLEVVRRIRARGGLAIQADLASVLAYWPTDWPIDVISADFCCGFEPTIMREFAEALFFAPMNYGSVAMINLQRGRGKEGVVIDALGLPKGEHRGTAFVNFYICRALHDLGMSWNGPSEKATRAVCDALYTKLDAQITTYSSTGSLKFDSVIFNALPHRSESRAIEFVCPKYKNMFDDVRHQVAALRAVRTRKLAA